MKNLSDVCTEITAGGAAPQGERFFQNGEYPFVRVADMGTLSGAKILRNTRDHINEEGSKKLRLFPRGTVLFTKSGASLLLNQRAVLDQPMYVVSHIGCLIPGEEVTSDWLYYWMRLVDFAKYAHATTLPSLKLSVVKGLEVPVPPIDVQVKIIARIEELFSELDNGVETLRKTKQQLAVYRQAVLKAAFSDISQKDYHPLKTVLLGTPQNGLYKPKTAYGSGTRILRIDGFYDGRVLEDYVYKRLNLSESELMQYRLNEMDLVVNRVNSMTYLGKCALIRNLSETTVYESNMMRMQLDCTRVDPEYVTYYLSSHVGRKELTKNAKQAVNQASINQTDVGNSLVPVPPSLEHQKGVVSAINARMSVCDNIEKTVDTALQQAEAMRQSILKKAFEGRL